MSSEIILGVFASWTNRAACINYINRTLSSYDRDDEPSFEKSIGHVRPLHPSSVCAAGQEQFDKQWGKVDLLFPSFIK